MKALKLLALSSALSLGVMAAPASAAELIVDGDWQRFSWSGLGSWAPDFTFTLSGSGELQIVDCCITGDRFEVFIDGVSQGLTTASVDGISTGATSGDTAWADTRLSRGSYLLGPGSYTATGTVVQSTSQTSSGAGFARVVSVGGAVPEPATWAMMLLGFFGIGGAMRTRKSRQRVTVSYADI